MTLAIQSRNKKHYTRKGTIPMQTEITVTLSRLNCNGCVRNVTKALQTLPELEIIQTDIATKTVHLRYAEDQVSLEQIKKVLLEANYPVVAQQPVS
ncbi:MAG: heavy-metal-associated domain-containing protein [Chloroflexi bacterium]|nr:MAG: heavy-metal-associated domain-containing protein [Chloroflexota bacterium]